MTEQHGYIYNRVLIDVDVALDSPFDDGVLWFSGAQIGMLRTIVRYLRRQHTFVETYEEGYYTSPSTEDWDTISALVADLENTLMGNPNTLWGYEDRLLTMQTHIMIAPGTFVQSHTTVPEGEVWVVEGLSVGTSHTGASVYALNYVEAVNYAITELITPPMNTWKVRSDLRVVMKEDDGIRFAWNSLVVDQNITTFVWGYKMKVPV